MAAIRSIHIHQLLRLRDIHLDFQESGVTAIMGANGSGKTTLLQGLACIYRNDTRIGIAQEQYRYTDFYKNYNGNDWVGSAFDVEFFEENTISYQKINNYWSPPTQHKKVRYTKYIPVIECVPDQEKERTKTIDEFTTPEFDISPAKKTTLLRNVTGALNKSYNNVSFAEKNKGLKQFMHASVNDRSLGEVSYPSHYMGAGEQKIIHLMKEVLRAPNNSLILIEELDVSLHDSAIQSLINFLLEQAQQRNLQIVFTTHWLRIQEFENEEYMNILSLYVSPATDMVTVRNGFDPQFIHNINNDFDQLRQIKVWVEDGLAQKIVQLVARKINALPYIQIKAFGTIQNAYMLAGAVSVMGDNLDRTLIVTDGDRYRDLAEKKQQINLVIDGHGEQVLQWRSDALNLITDLETPEQFQPEKIILDICEELVHQRLAPHWIRDNLEWVNQQNPRPPNGKEVFRLLAEHRFMQMDTLENQYLEVVCVTDDWATYTNPLENKLKEVIANIGIVLEHNEVAA